MIEPKHTPTPWTHHLGTILAIRKCGNRSVAITLSRGMHDLCEIDTFDEREANAALIVRAVNAHEQLVGALESVAQAFAVEHIAEVIPPSVMAKVKAALRAARGEK